MPIEKDKLRMLSPEERIKRLKELEEERLRDVEEAQDLIKRTEAEIERNKDIPDIEVPEIEPVDISKIFESPEGLETTVQREVPAEDTPEIKYTPSADYSIEIPSLWEVGEGRIDDDERLTKVEDIMKYETTAEKSDTTASRDVIKQIKKYTMG